MDLETKTAGGKKIIIPKSEIDQEYLEECFNEMKKNPRGTCWIVEIKCKRIDECYKKFKKFKCSQELLPVAVLKEFGDCNNLKILCMWIGIPQPFSERLVKLIEILKAEKG